MLPSFAEKPREVAIGELYTLSSRIGVSISTKEYNITSLFIPRTFLHYRMSKVLTWRQVDPVMDLSTKLLGIVISQ